MFPTTNMSLVVWDDLDDEYDHTQLAANWIAVDAHDHSAGKGEQIPTGGLADHSVTNVKLATNSVTSNEIVNQTITGGDIANGQITYSHLAAGVLDGLYPLGLISPWFRPSMTVNVPTGWVICDGSTVSDHSYPSIGSFAVPDLRNKFILGAALSGTGTNTNTPPAENAIGGSHVRTFNHTHTIPGHSHTVNSHSHTVNTHNHNVNSHNHVVDAHSHTISSDGAHNHNMHSRLNAFLQGLLFSDKAGNDRNNSLQSIYVAGFNNGSVDDPIPATGTHTHGGITGNASPNTSVASPDTSYSSPGTSTSSPGTNNVSLNTDLASSGGDIRPGFVGLLYIIKIKHPS